MSTTTTARVESAGVAPRITPQRIAAVRAVVALLWAAAVVLAVGDGVPSTASDVPVAVAVLLAAYPLIDVTSSVLGASGVGSAGRSMRINAAISALAVIAIGAAAFGSDAGATLIAFGSWAVVSGAIQLGVALQHRREGRRLPMMISGGLSTVAGLSFVAAAGEADANLLTLGGYMAVGAILSLTWAVRTRPAR